MVRAPAGPSFAGPVLAREPVDSLAGHAGDRVARSAAWLGRRALFDKWIRTREVPGPHRP